MRRLVGLVLGLVVLIAAIGTVWMYTREISREADLVIVQVDGEVKLYSPGRSGAGATVGRALAARDRLATGEDARAVLALGAETRIRLGPTSTIQVQAIDDQGVRLELEGGALQATVRPDAGAVRIGSRGREVVATNADFSVGVRDDVLQVGATRGSVSLAGVDGTRIEAGSQATIVDRHAEIGPVPEAVLLDVEWPQAARTRDTLTKLRGTTAPGAVVRLQGPIGEEVVVRADHRGVFVAELPLAEGDNAVRIEALDVFGNRAAVDGALQTRDTLGPGFRGGVQYGQ